MVKYQQTVRITLDSSREKQDLRLRLRRQFGAGGRAMWPSGR